MATTVAPLGRAEAIARIGALVLAGEFTVGRRANDRMRALGYDLEDVEEFLCGLSEDECIHDEPPDHPDLAPSGWIYEFVIELEDDTALYVKVCLNPENVYVLSFKLDGSPA